MESVEQNGRSRLAERLDSPVGSRSKASGMSCLGRVSSRWTRLPIWGYPGAPEREGHWLMATTDGRGHARICREHFDIRDAQCQLPAARTSVIPALDGAQARRESGGEAR